MMMLEHYPRVRLSVEEMDSQTSIYWPRRGREGWFVRFSRHLVWLSLSMLQHIDIYGGRGAEYMAGKPVSAVDRFPKNESALAKWRRLCEAPIWMQLIRAVFLLSTINLIFQTFWLHLYCQRLFSIERLNSKLVSLQAQARAQPRPLDSNVVGSANFLKGPDELEEQRRQIVERLATEMVSLNKTLNVLAANPYISFGIAWEVASVFIIIVSYATYFYPQLHFNLWRPLNCSTLRSMIDGKLEQRFRTNPMICEQVDKYIVSSETFLHLQLNDPTRFYRLNTGLAFERKFARRGRLTWRETCAILSDFHKEATNIKARQQTINEHLKQLTLRGLLQPPNRNSEWLRKLVQYYAIIELLVISCGLLMISFVLLPIPTSGLFSERVDFSNPASLLIMAQLYLHCIIMTLAVAICIAFLVVASLDQLRCVQCLIECADSATRTNDTWLSDKWRGQTTDPLDGHLAPGGHPLETTAEFATLSDKQTDKSRSLAQRPRVRRDSSVGSLSHQLNANALLLLLGVKIFVYELETVHSSLGLGASFCFMLMYWVPVMGRMYCNHMEVSMRLIISGVGVTVLFFCDLILTPLCRLHSRCQQLNKSLSTFLAHSVELISVHGNCDLSNGGAQIYDDHTIWLLRKELQLTEQGSDRLATRTVFGVKVTYLSLLSVHFWTSLLMVSMFSTKTKQPDQEDDSMFGGNLLHFF